MLLFFPPLLVKHLFQLEPCQISFNPFCSQGRGFENESWCLDSMIRIEGRLAWVNGMLKESEVDLVLTVLYSQKCLWGMAHSPEGIYAADHNQKGKTKTKQQNQTCHKRSN